MPVTDLSPAFRGHRPAASAGLRVYGFANISVRLRITRVHPASRLRSSIRVNDSRPGVPAGIISDQALPSIGRAERRSAGFLRTFPRQQSINQGNPFSVPDYARGMPDVFAGDRSCCDRSARGSSEHAQAIARPKARGRPGCALGQAGVEMVAVTVVRKSGEVGWAPDGPPLAAPCRSRGKAVGGAASPADQAALFKGGRIWLTSIRRRTW
jgi:hypothetical protein